MVILNFAPDQTWPVTELGAGCASVQEKQSPAPVTAAVIGHRRPSVDLHFLGVLPRPGVEASGWVVWTLRSRLMQELSSELLSKLRGIRDALFLLCCFETLPRRRQGQA